MEHGPTSGAEPGRELRILLVEDKWLVAERLRTQLEGLGHRVEGLAMDAREAVHFARSLQPDLVITDIGLPLIDGIETARTLLAHQAVPIILLTAYASADFVRQARAAGVMAHLVTPVDRRQLGQVIDQALARFRELAVIRREASDLEGALETRNLVERAKRVFMRRLKVSESEAFRRLQQQGRTIGAGLGESASAILTAEERLFRNVNVVRNLQFMLAAVRQGLRFRPAGRGVPAPARSRSAPLEPPGELAERSRARRPRSDVPLPFQSRGEAEARPPRRST